ncbi:hypothetical protein BH790_gp64 [Gordonia phage Gsput1]|uniref:Uncharacterized protein n=1 Tax=Gordonia phage Gsput1 TaxID=1622193 RepID=A0A0E3T708_9CAUD|nr:hypothetical protein BH790_gp64 [Gordonia phage Gsput1]AKC03089.1 hypothetical protein Gsput1_64 [Gordonia phage Gsput1]
MTFTLRLFGVPVISVEIGTPDHEHYYEGGEIEGPGFALTSDGGALGFGWSDE